MDKRFTDIRPMMLKNPEAGSEPPLQYVLEHYYTSHGIALATARKLTEEYVAQWTTQESSKRGGEARPHRRRNEVTNDKQAHVCDDPECVPANAPLAEKVRFLMAENARLREQIAELSDAFTVVWVSDDHAAWDGKAVEKFNALVATHNAKLTG